MSINAKEASKLAAEYYNDISRDRRELSIEEIEFDEATNLWLITLGISDPDDFAFHTAKVTKKDYKIFKIDSDSGEVKSMKIRKV